MSPTAWHCDGYCLALRGVGLGMGWCAYGESVAPKVCAYGKGRAIQGSITICTGGRASGGTIK